MENDIGRALDHAIQLKTMALDKMVETQGSIQRTINEMAEKEIDDLAQWIFLQDEVRRLTESFNSAFFQKKVIDILLPLTNAETPHR